MADRYDEPELKALARDGIKRCIAPDNVLQEMADGFALLFPEFLAMYKRYALDNWAKVVKADGVATAIIKLLERDETRQAYMEMLQNTVALAASATTT